MNVSDTEALSKQIRPFDFINSQVSDIEKEIFKYYGIDFSNEFTELRHHFGTINSPNSHLATHYFDLPNSQGTVFIMHGYFDHIGLYQHLIRLCLNLNYSVIGFDLPGHGFSTGSRASIDDFDHYVEALKYCVDFFCQYQGTIKPWHIIGQSTGAAITMDYLLNKKYAKTQCPFAHIILLAPLVRPLHWHKIKASYSILKWFISNTQRQFKRNSHNEQFLKFLREEDPLQHNKIPLKWLGSLKQWIHNFKQYTASSLAPVIIQGKQDLTVDWKYNIPHIQTKFSQTKVHYLEHAKHHLVNESEEIRKQLFDIIESHIGQ